MGAPKIENESPNKERTLSIYGYTSFRVYLKDFYEFRKEGQHGYSYRAFSKAAGFSSPNFLKLVIEGQRNISADAVEKFIAALKLRGPMAEYFRALVKMNQAQDDNEKEKWFHHLKQLTPHSKRRSLQAENLRYLSHWLYPALLEMVHLRDFRFDPYWIARRLHTPVSMADIVSAWNFLLEEGFVLANEQGGFTVTDSMVLSSDEVGSLAIRNYHRQMLTQAAEALTNLPMGEREFGALTFILPSNAIDELKQKLKVFRKELHEWAIAAVADSAATAEAEGKGDSADSGESVIQVNMQMYPHTRKVATS